LHSVATDAPMRTGQSVIARPRRGRRHRCFFDPRLFEPTSCFESGDALPRGTPSRDAARDRVSGRQRSFLPLLASNRVAVPAWDENCEPAGDSLRTELDKIKPDVSGAKLVGRVGSKRTGRHSALLGLVP
jgi:hypothetical protein